jgi:RNA polymerase sigma-70 factor (ECF subfamily)
MDPHYRAMYADCVHQHANDLYRLAYRLCGNADTAEDLVQEAFYHAWKNLEQLRDGRRAKAWLFQILRHRYAHWVRDCTRQIQPQSLERQPADAVDPNPSSLTQLARRDDLQEALNELDDTMKTPLLMVYLEGLTCREAAESLDIPLGSLLSRIHRARQKLQARLADSQISPRRANPASAKDAPKLRLGGEL